MTRALEDNVAFRRIRRRARVLSNSSIELTSGLRMLPGFLIVGAQRSGTTSLFKTLIQHPAVARPFLRKGVHFFDNRYERGLDWYRGNFPLTATSRLRRLGSAGPLTGESSPYYMFHPLAPWRIARDLPEVKLLVLLRDPVERAYSAHSHELARGYETEPFERALALEPARLAGERERMASDEGYRSAHVQHNAYLTRGHYVEQLRALEAAVGRHRVLVLDSDDFFTTPDVVWRDICGFLGLPLGTEIAFERHNARQRAPLDSALRQRLREHYSPYDEELTAWWGRVPSWRR